MCINENKDILVVDDSDDNLILMQLIFESQGCRIRQARNGNEGLSEVAQACPDLIILDLMMPDMSGFEFMRCLKNHDLSDIPVILLTANAFVSKEQAQNVHDICHKPFDLDDLLYKVQSLLPCPGSCTANIPKSSVADVKQGISLGNPEWWQFQLDETDLILRKYLSLASKSSIKKGLIM